MEFLTRWLGTTIGVFLFFVVGSGVCWLITTLFGLEALRNLLFSTEYSLGEVIKIVACISAVSGFFLALKTDS